MVLDKKKIRDILIWVLMFQLVGALLGFITQTNIAPWYQILNKSSLTPPPIVFSIVWPILYVLLALVGYLLWHHRHEPRSRVALYFFIPQMLMNWSWTVLFFKLHYIGLSFIWILVMAALTLITLYVTRIELKRVSIMLLPYLLWILFAAYLNGVIWLFN